MRKHLSFTTFLLVLMACLSWGCTEDITSEPEPKKPDSEQPVAPAEESTDKEETQWVPSLVVPQIKTTHSISLSEEEISALNKMQELSFSFNSLCGETANTTFNSEDGSYCFSPVSAIMSLILYANSIDEPARSQVATALGMENMNLLNELAYKLLSFLPGDCYDSADIRFANSVWYSGTHSISSEFGKFMAENFAAPVMPFFPTSPDAVRPINEWCSMYTNNLIPRILNNIPPNTEIMWFNAMYFADEWTQPFDEDDTAPEIFHGTHTASTIDMMHSTKVRSYAKKDGIAMTELLFSNGYSYKFYVILPDENISTEEASKRLTATFFNELKSQMVDYEVELSLPKFKMQQNGVLDQVFNKLGLPTSNVKLTAIGLPDNVDVSISGHQTSLIDIDEYGAKIAAVTYEAGASWCPTPEYSHVVFNVNRPFLFVLTNERTGAVMLSGRINNI